jgi:FG-GAP-like repeat
MRENFMALHTSSTVFLALLFATQTLAAEAPWTRHMIDKGSEGADGVKLADVNGDGLLDVVTGWEEGGTVRISFNPGPAKAKEPWKVITTGKAPNVEDAVFFDVDGDGIQDVVACSEGKTRSIFVHWAPKERADYMDETQWKTEVLPAAKERMPWMFCLPLQVDGKAGVDIVAGGKVGNASLGWFEAPTNPRDLAGWIWHPWVQTGWLMSLCAEDMDGDGDSDVLVSNRKAPNRGVFWMENPGAMNALKPWTQRNIGGSDSEVMFLNTVDLDGDGLKDVVCAAKPRMVYFFRRKSIDGLSWDSIKIPIPADCGTTKGVAAGDIDGNGKIDLVFTCEEANGELSGCRWLSFNKSPLEPDWTPHEISGSEGTKFDRLELIDLDGDGDLDVLTCAEIPNMGVFWYENPAK